MGAFGAWQRLSTPAALALVLALAGSTSPTTHSDAAGLTVATAGATVGVGSDPGSQPSASTTVVDPYEYPVPIQVDAPEPAVRIAATGNPAGTTVRADIADVLLQAYQSAAAGAPPTCHLPVSLLAAIGQVESGSLAGRPIDAEHRTSVLGPVLDGNGFAAIPDTDDGRWDGDASWDRAVGPMQFIPSTWATFGVDGDGDGDANPQDVEDAAAGTAAYLCYGGRDLSQPAALRTAVLSYNHSESYLRLVLTYQQRYASLGLDSGTVVKGLPTTIALTATPVGADGWQPRAVQMHHETTPAATKTPAAGKTPKSRIPRPSGTATGTPSGASTSKPGTSPSSPGTPGGDPTGQPGGDPTNGPTDDPTAGPTEQPSGPPTPAADQCPTAPQPEGAPPPSDEVTGAVDANGEPSCPPCPAGATPTEDDPCWQDPAPEPAGASASAPPTEAAVSEAAEASPSSGP